MASRISIERGEGKIVVSRSASSTFLGVIVYLIAGPFILFFFALVGALATIGVAHFILKRDEDAVGIAALIVGGLFTIVGLLWLVQDFRRRQSARVSISLNEIEIRYLGNCRRIPVTDVTGISQAKGGRGIALHVVSGAKVTLPSDLATPVDFMPLLTLLVVPKIVDHIEAHFAAGNALVLRDLGLRAVFEMYGAFGWLLGGIFAMATVLHIHSGIQMIGRAIIRARQSVRAMRGGFIMSAVGPESLDGSIRRSWSDIREAEFDQVGLVLHFRQGDAMKISRYADHYFELWKLFNVHKVPIRSAAA